MLLVFFGKICLVLNCFFFLQKIGGRCSWYAPPWNLHKISAVIPCMHIFSKNRCDDVEFMYFPDRLVWLQYKKNKHSFSIFKVCSQKPCKAWNLVIKTCGHVEFTLKCLHCSYSWTILWCLKIKCISTALENGSNMYSYIDFYQPNSVINRSIHYIQFNYLYASKVCDWSDRGQFQVKRQGQLYGILMHISWFYILHLNIKVI